MTASPYFITTAIPYVNALPHVGFAMELVLADAIARYRRLTGRDVRFLTGTDENSLKNVRAAEQAGLSTEVLVDRNAARYRALREALGLDYDDFIRTSVDARHRRGAERLWAACSTRGDIYRRSYGGLYCVGCEDFYTESDLADGRCPEHGSRPEWVEEENYFFRLSRYEGELHELVESGRVEILPEGRRNEVLAFIERGLEDISVSRSRSRARGWGIPVPGDPGQVMYVWFDALGNYISALGYGTDHDHYRRYWLESSDRVHVIGKGITRFHAVYWPAILLSAGVRLPSAINVHGYVTVAGEKISKSRGNVIDPFYLVQKYGSDTLRYFLLRHIRSTEDGDFTIDRLVAAHNKELAGQLGNLLNRTVRMIERYSSGFVPAPERPPSRVATQRLRQCADSLPAALATRFDRFQVHEAVAELWRLVAEANRCVEEAAPWAHDRRRREASDARERASAHETLNETLFELGRTVHLIGRSVSPFLPNAARQIASQIGITSPHTGPGAGLDDVPGVGVTPGAVIFPTIELASSESP